MYHDCVSVLQYVQLTQRMPTITSFRLAEGKAEGIVGNREAEMTVGL